MRDWMAPAAEPAWKAVLNGGGGWTRSIGYEKHTHTVSRTGEQRGEK